MRTRLPSWIKRRQESRGDLGPLHPFKQTWFCEAGGRADIVGISGLAAQYLTFPGIRENGIASPMLARRVRRLTGREN